MTFLRSLVTVIVIAVAVAAPPTQAGLLDVYQATFQGITFTFTETGTQQLTFNIAGTPSDDWAGVTYLGAFDIKGDELGVDASTVSAIANGPGAINLAAVNQQLSGSAAGTVCGGMGTGGSLCFNLSPDYAFGSTPMNLTYVIDFDALLNVSAVGPHLQIAWDTSLTDGRKQGSLYSQNVARVPEPSSSSLMLVGLCCLGATIWLRRRSARNAALAVV
jgi:hypothetical protein